MIIGAHSILYSTDAEADRAFLRDVLKLPNVDVGEGWLIFGLPPAEVAVHPHDSNDLQEFYLMCEDVEKFVAAMKKQRIACEAPNDMGWGILTHLTLPGGGKLGVYQPRHARPKSAGASKPAKRATNGASRSNGRMTKLRGRKRAATPARRKASPKKAARKRRS
jgi:hypothetical protein